MNWSKLRKEIGLRIVPELRKRVGFHFTRYRMGKSDWKGRDYGRFWITVDGAEVFSADSEPYREGSRINSPSMDGYQAVGKYLSLDIRAARASGHPVLRALSMIDSRTGVRSLRALDEASMEALPRRFYQLRMERTQDL